MNPAKPEVFKRHSETTSRLGRRMQRRIIFLISCAVLVSAVVVGIVAYNRVRSWATAEAQQTLISEARLMSQRFSNT